MEIVDVNFLAVVVASVVYFGIGSLWYSPLLFAKPWMEASGIADEKMNDSGNAWLFVATFGLVTILTYVLAHILEYVSATSLVAAVATGVWVWLGFVATTMTINSLFAGKDKKLVVINAGYHLVGIVAAAAILHLFS